MEKGNFQQACQEGEWQKCFELKYWLVKVRGSDFSFQKKITEKQIMAGVNYFTLELPDFRLCSILAYPVFEIKKYLDNQKIADCGRQRVKNNRSIVSCQKQEIKGFFYPAGCIYPYSKNLTWLQGFSSSLLYDFYYHSKYSGNSGELSEAFASCFNWKKLCEEVEKRDFLKKESGENSGQGPFNPWLLDRTEILSSIENSVFSVNLLKLSKSKIISRKEMNEALVKLLPGYSAVDKGFYTTGKSAGLEVELLSPPGEEHINAEPVEIANSQEVELLSSPGEGHIYQVREELSFFQEDYCLLLSPYMPENIKSAESFERPRPSEFSFLFAYPAVQESNLDGSRASLSLNFYRLFVKVDSQGMLSYYLTDFL
ncbi:MAG: hypothetical protein K6E78_07945 [Treponema sp.]|nr:hypothetical protein [Treponema sp.]